MNYHAVLVTAAWMLGESAFFTALLLWGTPEHTRAGRVALLFLAVLCVVCAVLAGVAK